MRTARRLDPLERHAHLEALRLAWCSDCQGMVLLEPVPDDSLSRPDRDWACTTCGAAYLDGIDLTVVTA